MIDQDPARTFLEGLIMPALLAAFGGLWKACSLGSKGWRFAGSVAVAAFTGAAMQLFIAEMHFPDSAKAALLAASGYSGAVVMDALVAEIIQRIQKQKGRA